MPGGIHPPVQQWLIWPKPNYIDPPTKPKYILFFSCLFGPISIALILARLWVRLRIQKNPGWDDWFMLASWFPVMALTIIYPLVTERYYFNRHSWDVEFQYFPLQRHYVMAIYALFTLASGLIKMSVLLFYRRLASRAVSPAFRWTLRITIAVIGIYTTIFVFITIFMCSPVSAFWDQENIMILSKGGYEYKCANEGAEVVANGIISTVQDFIAASLPAVLCWKLQMPFRQKLALYSVFAVSYSAVALGALRTYTSYRLFFETYDVTWAACDVWLWSLLEMHIGSMCANAPALKAFYMHYFAPQRSTHATSHRPTYANYSTTNSSLWGKVSFWKKLSSRASSGYLSESHTSKHGAIVQTSQPEYVETTIARNDARGWKNDIEMGRIHVLSSTEVSVGGSEVAALSAVREPEHVRGWKA